MTPIIFDTEDAPYLRWMAANPAGYVLKTGRHYAADDPRQLLLQRYLCGQPIAAPAAPDAGR